MHSSVSHPNKETPNAVSDEQIKDKLDEVLRAFKNLEEMRTNGVGPPPQRAEVLQSFLKDLHNSAARKKDARALLDSAQRYLSDLGKEEETYSDVKMLDWFP